MAGEPKQEAWEQQGMSFPDALKQGLVSPEKLKRIRNEAAAEIAYATAKSTAAPNFKEIEQKAQAAMDYVLGKNADVQEGSGSVDWFVEEAWNLVKAMPDYRDEHIEYLQAHSKMFLGKYVAESDDAKRTA